MINTKQEKGEFQIRILYPILNLACDDIEYHTLSPLSRIRELGIEWIIEFDLPMVNKKDISVTLDNENTITIEAKLKEIYDVEQHGCKSKFEYFKKSITLPQRIDKQKIKSKFENGILTIRIPKLLTSTKINIE